MWDEYGRDNTDEIFELKSNSNNWVTAGKLKQRRNNHRYDFYSYKFQRF